MLKLKDQKGITLIALVITIIVLLILAGITITMLSSQDSAPQKAVEGKSKSQLGTAQDAIALKASNYITDYYDKKYVKNETPTDASKYAAADRAVTDTIKEEANKANSEVAGVYLSAHTAPSMEGTTYTPGTFTLNYDGQTVTGTIGEDGQITY